MAVNVIWNHLESSSGIIIWNVMCSLVNDTNLSKKPSAIFEVKVEDDKRVKMKVTGSFENLVPKKFHCVTLQTTIFFIPL